MEQNTNNALTAGQPGPNLPARIVDDRFGEALRRGAFTRDPHEAKLFDVVGAGFRSLHHAAEVVGVQGRDYSRPVVTGGRHFGSHAEGAVARDHLRAACAAIGEAALPYINGSLIENRSLVELGQTIAGLRSRKHAVERAKRHVVEGLQSLATFWRLAPNAFSSGVTSVREDGIRRHEHH